MKNTFAPNGRVRVSRSSGLRRFAVPARTPGAASGDGAVVPGAEERCEMCGESLGREHAHLADLRQRSIGCACTACALLFTRPGGRYRTIPDRVLVDPGAPLTEAEWARLAIPVAIAFFFVNSDLGHVVASYPSPAGVTECELDLAAWDQLAEEHPLLREPEADVEAILVVAPSAPHPDGWHIDPAIGGSTDHPSGPETFLVAIDVCYRLAGALRAGWRGFDGGPEVRKVLANLLDGLRERARPLG